MSHPESAPRMVTVAPAPQRWAFWRYDAFPGLLGGQIRRVKESVSTPGALVVETKQFGVGNWFRPVFCLERGPGEELYALLKTMRTDYEMAMHAIRVSHEASRDATLERFGALSAFLNKSGVKAPKPRPRTRPAR